MEHRETPPFFSTDFYQNAQETMDLSFQKTCFLSKNHQCLSLELTIRIITAGLNNRLLGSQMFGGHPSCIFQLILVLLGYRLPERFLCTAIRF